jgi:hypothetical protein
MSTGTNTPSFKSRPMTSESNISYFNHNYTDIQRSSSLSTYQLNDNKPKSGFLFLGNFFRPEKQQNQKRITAEIKEMIVKRNDELLGLTPVFRNLTMLENGEKIKGKRNECSEIVISDEDAGIKMNRDYNEVERDYRPYPANMLSACDQNFSTKFPIYDPLTKEEYLTRSNTISFELQNIQKTFANSALTKFYPNTRRLESPARSISIQHAHGPSPI